ncbi:MFS transporter [Synechococcus sp. CS-1328]|uniref:MFS transporter n=1 Tax=Synechococcus sp. CS-1328 TaxID=2847976 RepID=UPI00223A6F23|nr:MFS transporter [Synechococcus sp. CS-1328]MCT0224758.1 MFS transporter [Synechococcus sp. CS-1328]
MGVSVANPFYSQSLLPPIAAALGLTAGTAVLVPAVTQWGLSASLLLLLPLGDRLERRRLLVGASLGMAVACLAIVIAPDFAQLLPAFFLVGLFALVPYLLPPFVAQLTPESQRGQVLGTLLSGQFSGLLLARTFSGVLAELAGWKTIYAVSAVLMVAVAALFRTRLPRQRPASPPGYLALQRSQLQLWLRYPALRQACLRQALLFGAFMATWSALALHLAAPPWRLGPAAIGCFGLVGLVSISAARPIGRLVDRHGTKRIVRAGCVFALVGLLLLAFGASSLPVLVIGMACLDLGVQGAYVAHQTTVLSLDASARTRLGTWLFFTAYLGAALCSQLVAHAWASWQWHGNAVFAASLVLLALLIPTSD